MKRLALFVVCGLACGQGPESAPVCDDLPRGSYTVDAYLSAHEGTCDFLPEYLEDGVAKFDATGDLISPFPGLVNCTTRRESDCRTRVECVTPLAPVRGTATLSLTRAGGRGEITARGAWQGCTAATYRLKLTPIPDSR